MRIPCHQKRVDGKSGPRADSDRWTGWSTLLCCLWVTSCALGFPGKQNRPPVQRGSGKCAYFLGGDEGTRTPDPHTASVMLSQLSYIPIVANTALRRAARAIIRDCICTVKPSG